MRTGDSAGEPAPRSAFGRAVHSRAARIFFGALWWLYGLWIAWIALQARDANWNWLVYTGLCAAVFGGLLLGQVQWAFDRSKEIGRAAGRFVVFGIAVAGLVASADLGLATKVVAAMAGPAALVWLAERYHRVQERSERLTQEIEVKQRHIEALKHAAGTSDSLNALMEGNLQLLKAAALTEVRRQASWPPVAGHRKRRRRPHDVHAALDRARAAGAKARGDEPTPSSEPSSA